MRKLSKRQKDEVVPDDEAPTCDMPGCDEPAEYNAQIPGGQGGLHELRGSSWANLCQEHFDSNGCSLGLGKGHKLVVRDGGKANEH